jgi:3-methyladenine DNA glycosylase AlkD
MKLLSLNFNFLAMQPNLISGIHDYCVERGNDANVLKYSRYFKEGLYNGFGLTSAQIYEGAKEFLRMPGISLQTVLDAAPDIIRHGKYEETGILMLLAKGLHKQFTRETFDNFSSWYKYGINNWAHADTMGMMILPVFLNKHIVAFTDFSAWLIAENKFQRRSVPVTMIKILKTHENYQELFTFIECLMSDLEREVHQGTGWFLREAWKQKPAVTESFLLKWKESSPRLIFQYATEKMTPEGKSKFRRQKR